MAMQSLESAVVQTGGNSVKIQPDAKIVVAGIGNNGTNFDVALLRYNSNGTLDSTFSDDGIVLTALKGNDFGHTLSLQDDGKIIVGGVTYGAKPEMALLRYLSNGSLDTTWAGTGYTTLDMGGVGNYAYTMALQPKARLCWLAMWILITTSTILLRYV